jgi:transglutaminase-like putative cysteine protease
MATVIEHKPIDKQPLRLESLLQINVGVLVILGTSLLAMGQRNAIYAIVAVVATATAIYVTDWKKVFHLGADATTLAAIFACVVLVVQVIRNVEQSQLLNVANILIYLEVILLFQQKQDRTYWSLMALSLLQVVVAAALNLGLIFGVLLGIYVMAAGTALMLFFAVREIRPFVHAGGPAESAAQTLLASADAGEANAATFIGSVSRETGSQVINASLLKRLGRMIAITALGTVVLFFAIPRYNSAVWQGARQDQVTTVGFTEEVRLDDIGRILESPEQVMRVEFTDLQGRPYEVDGEPYFHGTVLSDYHQGKGVWKQEHRRQWIRPLSNQSSFDLASIVLQRITLQPGRHSVLFNATPCHPVDDSPRDLNLNVFTGQLTLADEDNQGRGSFRYTLGTSAFRNGWQRDLIPANGGAELHVMRGGTAPRREELQSTHPSLVALADSVIAQLSLESAGMFERCKALENHFTRSGIYRYSLNVNQNRNRVLDPIEDFVSNHHTGHCEYFAGALTLMLRSQGIPARMVVGYKGGEFNAVGQYYIVRQLHAHAWVEAFLPNEEIPEDEFDVTEFPEYGCWLRLDPTPDFVEATQDEAGWAVFTTVREFIDYCQVLWDDYVLGLNSTRQQQAIYRPVIRSLKMAAENTFGASSWEARVAWLRGVGGQWMAHRTLGVPTLWLVLAAAAGLVPLACRWRRPLARGVKRLLARLGRRRSGLTNHRPQLEAYRRFEMAMVPFGLVRAPTQTPFEFATAVETRLTKIIPQPTATDIPRRIAEAYYRFRFGQERLTDAETGQLMAGVQQLESLFRAATHSAGRPRNS